MITPILIGGGLVVSYILGKRVIRQVKHVGTAAIQSSRLVMHPRNALGVDVSAAQGTIAWQTVRASKQVDFAIVKLTDGLGHDLFGAKNMAGAKQVGILRGGYHYSSYRNPPDKEADNFADAIKAGGGIELPPVLDFEHVDPATNLSPFPKAVTCKWAIDFIRRMHARGFPRVWLYSYPAYLTQLMPDLVESGLPKLCDLWIADYSQGVIPKDGAVPVSLNPKHPLFIKGGWPTWVAWQTHGNDDKTAKVRIPGIGDAVDRDVFNGSVSQLRGKILGII